MPGGVSVSQPGAATRRFASAARKRLRHGGVNAGEPLMVWQASRWTAGVKATSSVRLPGRYLERVPRRLHHLTQPSPSHT